jgi:hypothetical protein
VMEARVREWGVDDEDEDSAVAIGDRGRDELQTEQVFSEASTGLRGGVGPRPRPPMAPHMVPPPPTPVAVYESPRAAQSQPYIEEYEPPPAVPPQVAFEPPRVQFQPYIEEYSPQPELEGRQAETPSIISLPPDPRPGKTDYIHICDSYPPIVLDSLRAQQPSPVPSSSSSSSGSSSTTTQPIPRAYIPRPLPRAAFQYPQYPPQTNRQYWKRAPTSYPMQWLPREVGMGAGHMRYAPYDLHRSIGEGRPKEWLGRRLAPSR